MADKKEEDLTKKGIIGTIKDKILPDEEEQAAIISTFVRITVLAWSGGISVSYTHLTLPTICSV